MILGTVGIPTICLILLIGAAVLSTRAPSAGRCAARSRWSRSILVVVSMGVLTYKGATAKEALGERDRRRRCRPGSQKNNLPPEAVPGAKLFAESGCLNCHTYLGVGSSTSARPT